MSFSAFQLFSFQLFLLKHLREQVAGQDAVEAAVEGLGGFEAAFEFGLLGFGQGGGLLSAKAVRGLGLGGEGALDLNPGGLQFFAHAGQQALAENDAETGLGLIKIPTVPWNPDLADSAEVGQLADDDAGAGFANGKLGGDVLKSGGTRGQIQQGVEAANDAPKAKGGGGVASGLDETTALLEPGSGSFQCV